MILLQVVKVFGLFMISFLAAFSLAPFVARFLGRIGAGKQIRDAAGTPVFARLHERKAGIPTMAGILVWGTTLGIAFVIFFLSQLFDGFWDYLNFVDRAQTYLPIAAMLLAALLGLADDLLGIRRIGPRGGGLAARHKLLIYLVLALVGACWFYFKLGWTVLAVPFVGEVNIGFWYVPVFIFVIVGSAFSANETDGLDGLAGGVLLFAFIALTVVAFALGRYDLAVFGGVVIGALLAFLWFNIYPAQFIMGDTGSMSLGITMGVIAMLTNTTLLLPFFAFVLVFESLSVIIQVISKKARGKKVFLSSPIHHHFEAKGWPETQVTMRFWIISALSAAFGLALFFLSWYLLHP